MVSAREMLERAVRERLTEVEADYIMHLADIYAFEQGQLRVRETLEELARRGGKEL